MVLVMIELHRFFKRQALYPLILASLLCLVLFILRVLYSGRFLEYRNLVWNLVLAWIPYTISLSIASAFYVFQRSWWLLVPGPGLFWLLFFPNAAYIVTDFWHLANRPPVPLWFDIGLVVCYAITGCLLTVVSLHTMQELVSLKLGRWVGWIFAVISLVFCSLGIYLGRFGRFNSWDFLLRPREVLKAIALPVLDPLDNLRFLGFTLLFSAILIVFYLTFTSFSSRLSKD